MKKTTVSLLAIASLLSFVESANAIQYTFSFSNDSGPVNGTVSGTIELPGAAATVDGTYAATSVLVTSAPVALGWTTPLDVFNGVTTRIF